MNIASQIYPVKYCFAINLQFISQGELKRLILFNEINIINFKLLSRIKAEAEAEAKAKEVKRF
ncbi:MAG: hypothetical protein K8R35_03685 [Bacteroidales bacterium]|nr:hypothetical protein [Bacteroidales bacterium]